MGIVRLAKSLKLLNSLSDYGSRENDLRSKIPGNRVYMDFVSIVYRIQESVANELNHLLFTYILIQNDLLDPVELSLAADYARKYVDVVGIHVKKLIHNLWVEYENADILSYRLTDSKIYKELKKEITPAYVETYKADVKSSNNLNIYIYRDVINFIVDMLTKKITSVEYVLIAFDGIPSYAKVQEQRQRRYMRYAQKEFEAAVIERDTSKGCIKTAKSERDTARSKSGRGRGRESRKSNKSGSDKSGKQVMTAIDRMACETHAPMDRNGTKYKLFSLRKRYDADHFIVDIKSAIDYVYSTYHTGSLQKDIEDGILGNGEKAGDFASSETEIDVDRHIEVEVIDRPYGEGEKILMDRLIRDVNIYDDHKSYVFYSPDGDSVLLCLYSYIKTKPKELTVVKMYELEPSTRHNHQSQYVNIGKLYDNIVKTVRQFSGEKFESVHDQDSICRDYMFMLNLYGNDFIHQLPSMDISTTILDLFYIYGLFMKESSNRFITKIIDDKVHIDYEVMTRFFEYLSEYEEYLMLDTYLTNIDGRGRIMSVFGDVFPHKYMIRYRELVAQLKFDLHHILAPNKGGTVELQDAREGLLTMIDKLDKSETVTGKKFSAIFKQLELKGGVEQYASKIATDPDSLLEHEPKFIYNVRVRRNRVEEEVAASVEKVESNLYKNGISVDIDSLEESRDRELSSFAFDYNNIREMLPHDQMPTTVNDIDLFLMEWRSGDWMTVLNSRSHEMGYDSKTKEVKDVRHEMVRYQKQMLRLSDRNLDKMIGNYLRTLSWMVDYYMNADIEKDQELISTWSYNYERSPMIGHISDYLKATDKKDVRNMMKKVYEKSLIHTSRYLKEDRHKFYIYPQTPDMVSQLGPRYHDTFPDIKIEVKKSIDYLEKIRVAKKRDQKSGEKAIKVKRPEMFFDCRECPYFSKCIFDASLLTFKELMDMRIPGIDDNKTQTGRGMVRYEVRGRRASYAPRTNTHRSNIHQARQRGGYRGRPHMNSVQPTQPAYSTSYVSTPNCVVRGRHNYQNHLQRSEQQVGRPVKAVKTVKTVKTNKYRY